MTSMGVRSGKRRLVVSAVGASRLPASSKVGGGIHPDRQAETPWRPTALPDMQQNIEIWRERVGRYHRRRRWKNAVWGRVNNDVVPRTVKRSKRDASALDKRVVRTMRRSFESPSGSLRSMTVPRSRCDAAKPEWTCLRRKESALQRKSALHHQTSSKLKATRDCLICRY